MLKIKGFIGFILLILTTTALASSLLDDVEVSVAGGAGRGYADNTYLVVSPVETDSVLAYQVSNNAIWKIGIGKHLFINQFRHFLNDVFFELNYYRSTFQIQGNVWQYELPEFNNYTFNAPVTSNRLMLDIKPRLITWQNLAPYLIIGIGAAWNKLAFHEVLIGEDVDPASVLSLSRKTNTNFAYDLGAGMRVKLSTMLTVSIEYLYTNLGKNIEPATDITGMTVLQAPPKFKLYSQSILFGLNWKIS